MFRRIRTRLARRVSVVIAGASNWSPRVKPATRQSLTGTFIAAQVKPATKVTQAASTLVAARVRAATRVTQIITGIIQPLQRPATRVTQAPSVLIAAQVKPATVQTFGVQTLIAARPKPATNVFQIDINLTHLSHVVTAAVDAGATGTWNNPTRIQGAPQGTQAGSASFAGGLILGTGKLRGTAMVAQVSRPASLAILEVWLQWHYQTVGLPVVSDLISTLALGYRIGGLPALDSDQASVTANEDLLVAGREIRIDNGAGAFTDAVATPVTWANIALLQPYFSATTIANGLMTYYADAIRLRVIARELWLP